MTKAKLLKRIERLEQINIALCKVIRDDHLDNWYGEWTKPFEQFIEYIEYTLND